MSQIYFINVIKPHIKQIESWSKMYFIVTRPLLNKGPDVGHCTVIVQWLYSLTVHVYTEQMWNLTKLLIIFLPKKF